MNRTPITSKLLKSVGHDEQTQTLEVEFTTGKVYRYRGVSVSQHAQLMDADSIGSHFLKNVKDAFPYERVEEQNA